MTKIHVNDEFHTTDFPQIVLLICDVNATDWHVVRSFDPDQKDDAVAEAKDYLTQRLRDGSQVALAEVRTYGIVDHYRRD